MKKLHAILLVASLGFVLAASPRAVASIDPLDASHLTPEYRRVRHIDESALSPFRKPEARAAQAALLVKNTGPNVPAVLAKFHEMVLTGVIPSTAKKPGLIILGGNIYKEGQEISLYDPKSRTNLPIVPEHKVVLRSVTAQALALMVTHFGESDKTLNVPVGLLEFQQR